MTILVLLALACRHPAPVEPPPVPEPQAAPMTPEPPPAPDITNLEDRPLYTFSEVDLDRYLRGLHQREPDLAGRVIHLARKNIGQPYQIYLLGEAPYETYDADPMYCLSKSDCVTFAEHTYAAALARDWPSYFNILQRLRYKDGLVGMLTRNHYTIADWDRNNAFIVEDLTQKLGGGRVWSPMRETIKRARFFAKYGIGQDIPDEIVDDAYIPKEKVPEILGELRDADLVHIIRGEKGAEWAGHVGLIALASHGVHPRGPTAATGTRIAGDNAQTTTEMSAVSFLHSADPAVREQPLLDYLAKDRRCAGIKILRLRENAQAIMDQEMKHPKFDIAPKLGDAKFNRDPKGSAASENEAAPTNPSGAGAQSGPPSPEVDSRWVAYRPASNDEPRDRRGESENLRFEISNSKANASPSTQPVSGTASTQAAMGGPPPVEVGNPKIDGKKPTMQDYRLEFDTPADPKLQSDLEAIDSKLGAEFGIPDADRACGVLDLTDLRLAMVRPDAMFYGASVPKIGILLAWFETHPEAAAGLAPVVERELQLMIKRSDNDMAARYSQLVGLDTIQRTLQSDKYRLYTREHGGLWCGKHYGLDQPRMGDPVHDHSHGATVRQCLRYYLMLEQGRLVSPQASEKMKSIFAAPLLDFHNHHFVKGLNGREVTLIRKSGEWEDWQLDTARIQHGDRAYLLAAMTHHPKGGDYLAALAAAVDEMLCGPGSSMPYTHSLVLHDREADLASLRYRHKVTVVRSEGKSDAAASPADSSAPNGCGIYESPTITSDIFFNEALPSWNLKVEPGAAFVITIRVGRTDDDIWSPEFPVGSGGEHPPAWAGQPVEWDHGRIAADYFKSDERFDRMQYTVHVYGNAKEREGLRGTDRERVSVARFALCLSDTTSIPLAIPIRKPTREPPAPDRWQRRLPVLHLGQGTDRLEMKSQICSPACVAMVLGYRGVQATPEEVADRAFDPIHKIYGNWPYNVQAAYTYGVPGYVTRFSDWRDVERMIAGDQPLIISIRYKEGEMPSAPMESTDGHLVVLCGFDADGNVLINDPARGDPKEGQYAARREELEKAWMQKGGTAYVLLPKVP